MKKIISMLLVFVMSFVFVSAIPSFAKDVPTFDLKTASINDTVDKAEIEVLASNDLDKKTKEQLVEKLREIKKKAKSNKHISSVIWDKVKEVLKATGYFTLGAAVSAFVTSCIFCSKSDSATAWAVKIDSFISNSSIFSHWKRKLMQLVINDDLAFAIKEDAIKLVSWVSLILG